MRKALTAIAHEIQRYHMKSPTSGLDSNEDIFKKLTTLKSNLTLKKKQVEKLRESLNIACIVAKTLLTAKENEVLAFNKHIHLARSQCNALLQKNINTDAIVEKFKTENQTLKKKIENIESFINLGYIEIQKMRNSRVKELSTMQQLKEIFISCGHHYANYYNEHEYCLQLERKNRFLNNKINIMQNSIEVTIGELNTLRYRNVKLLKENDLFKKKQRYLNSNIDHDINSTRSLYNTPHINEIIRKEKSITKTRYLDLTIHLSLIEMLLCDQDTMLKDLNKLSEEINNSSK
ncbi:girdin-like isoform X2 [Galleria mellonella]|nr:girdin-like isoform X2 [Galleria mellonella]